MRKTPDARLRPPFACTNLHMCIWEHAYPLSSNAIRQCRKCGKYEKNGNRNTHLYEDLFWQNGLWIDYFKMSKWLMGGPQGGVEMAHGTLLSPVWNSSGNGRKWEQVSLWEHSDQVPDFFLPSKILGALGAHIRKFSDVMLPCSGARFAGIYKGKKAKSWV